MDMEHEFASGACMKYEAMLEDYLDGALDTTSARKVAEHLSTCEGCSRALADATEASHFLHVVQPTADPGPAFTHMVMARVRTEDPTGMRASFWAPFISLAWKFATTAAVALVVMLAYASHGNSAMAVNNSSNASVTIPSDVRDMLVASSSGVPETRSEMVSMVTESDNAEQ